jgi:hypothetical protein
MPRKLRLTYVNTGETVLADMLEEEAPQVCQHVWDLLPVQVKLLHGMYSGAEVFAVLDNPRPAPPENLCQLPLPGEILYFYDDAKYVTAHNKPVAEICVVYNRGVILKGPESIGVHCSLFARIPGDWKHDWNDFQNACRKVRREGPQELRIERA